MCSHLLAVRETESLRGKILNKNKIETMGKKTNWVFGKNC